MDAEQSAAQEFLLVVDSRRGSVIQACRSFRNLTATQFDDEDDDHSGDDDDDDDDDGDEDDGNTQGGRMRAESGDAADINHRSADRPHAGSVRAYIANEDWPKMKHLQCPPRLSTSLSPSSSSSTSSSSSSSSSPAKRRQVQCRVIGKDRSRPLIEWRVTKRRGTLVFLTGRLATDQDWGNGRRRGSGQMKTEKTTNRDASASVVDVVVVNDRHQEPRRAEPDPVIVYRDIVQRAKTCYFVVNHRGFPTFMNPAAEQMTGYTLDEIRNRPLHYSLHWKPSDPSFSTSASMEDEDQVLVRKDRSECVVVCSVTPLSTDVGVLIELWDVTEERQRERDRLVELSHAAQSQSLRATEAETLQAKQTRFVDTICHECRNLVNGMQGNIALMSDELWSIRSTLSEVERRHMPGDLSQRLAESMQQIELCVDAISTCARHQKVLTDDVLHLSKLEAHKIELNHIVFNPMEVIHSAASMFMSQISDKRLRLRVNEPLPVRLDEVGHDDDESGEHERNVRSHQQQVRAEEMTTTVPAVELEELHGSGELVVRGDSDRFMQVVVNLISNAIKFTDVGGITVSLTYAHRPDHTTILQVEVADTGIGMKDEEQLRIFDRFSQASPKTYREHGGSGLGLSIARGLVRLMGGNMSVRSKHGEGSSFLFDIECGYVTPSEYVEHCQEVKEKRTATGAKLQQQHHQHKQKQKLQQKQAEEEDGDPERKRILVAEDNPINRSIVVRFFERVGHLCEAAQNGEEALRIYLDAVAKGRTFDAIFMDIEMPLLDGLGATRLIRERERTLSLDPPVPIIGLSGNVREQQIKHAMTAGMSDYITKPYDRQTILSKLALWTDGEREMSPQMKRDEGVNDEAGKRIGQVGEDEENETGKRQGEQHISDEKVKEDEKGALQPTSSPPSHH